MWQWLSDLFYPPLNEYQALKKRINRIATNESNAIDDLFIRHKIEARVDRKHVDASPTGGFIRYKLVNSSRVNKLVGLEDDLALIISEMRDTEVSVKIRKPRMVLELPYPLERMVLDWSMANLKVLGKYQALVGMDYTSLQVEPVVIDWSNPSTSNMLVSGETGSGKTNCLIEIALSLANVTPARDAQFIIIDPKFSPSLSMLRRLPHVTVYNEPEDCALALAAVKAEVNRRKRRPDKRKVFLFVEEIAELMIEAGGSKNRDTLFEQLKSIAQIGREQGVHVVACTQKATVEVIDTIVRANLPIRIAFKVGTVKESEIATGLPDVDCSRLPGKGAAYYVRDGFVQRIQTHHVSPEALKIEITEIAQRDRSAPYRIGIEDEVTAAATGLPDGITQEQLDKVLDTYSIEELFDTEGKLVRGIRIKIVTLLFGPNAASGGPNYTKVSKILDFIRPKTA